MVFKGRQTNSCDKMSNHQLSEKWKLKPQKDNIPLELENQQNIISIEGEVSLHTVVGNVS